MKYRNEQIGKCQGCKLLGRRRRDENLRFVYKNIKKHIVKEII